jgi:hypothetical protein
VSRFPKARSEQLIVRGVDRETIVYDTRVHDAMCLNEFASRVWGLCDGTRDVGQIDAACEDASSAMISQTLALLSKAGLLEEPHETASGTSRRKFVSQMAGLAGAVVVMTVPSASQAASCMPNGEPCACNDQCCSGICRANNRSDNTFCRGKVQQWAPVPC